MERNFLESAIMDIMRADGPDGHTDGSGIITDFIEAIQKDEGYTWIAVYRAKNEARLNRWKLK